MTDEEIIKTVQEGNSEVYGEIVKRYEKQIYRYIKRLTNQEYDTVEDLTQDTFISGYENIMSFDVDQKFSSWLYRVAHNKCIDFFRKKRVKTTTTEEKEELIESNDKLIEELEIEKEKNLKVNMAIESLELKYREVILLYYFEDKSYEDISDILHIQTSNVGVILNRAKEKLKKIL